MGSIILLDEHTINKIAAGEVVDRPASIVKELVENSIDAGATNISVEIKNGGIKYIKIVDNGIGFESDDIEMAFERHATSKIRKEEDLLKITSMGFRGEALASIASISRVSLITRNKKENVGTKALVESGKILSIEQIASNIGTKTEIKDVFYNVPARFKFLKKDYTEAGYVEDVITRTALANPQISFKYINNNKTIIQTSGSNDLKNTIYELFGKEIYENVIPVEYEYENMKIKGMIGLSNISRSTRMHQFTFLNSRYIKDKIINSAIDKAYSEKLGINKFAFAVINININPINIDVNVHPAKLEVKFDNESQVFNCVYYGIKTALENNNKQTNPFAIAALKENVDLKINKENIEIKEINQLNSKKFDFNLAEPKKENYSLNSIPKIEKNNSQKIENLNNLQENNLETIEEEYFNNLEKSEQKIDEIVKDFNIDKEEIVTGFVESVNKTEEIIDNIDNKVDDIENKNNINSFNNNFYEEQEIKNQKDEIKYKYIGQVFETYIIIQIDEKMYIIDQHAAHERLLYEQIKENYYSKDKQTQMMLIPILVELTSKEINIVMQNIEMFEKSGFIIEEFGENTIKISGVPNIGYDIDFKSMFIDIIDELLGATKTEKKDKEFRFIATLACKAAVKGNMKLTYQEQISLIDDMINLENPFTCPHGRPTAYEISKYEIERKFLRK